MSDTVGSYRPTGAAQAIRYRPGPAGNCDTVSKWIDGVPAWCDLDCAVDQWWVPGADVWAQPGDWIVRCLGEWRVVADREFREMFTPTSEATT